MTDNSKNKTGDDLVEDGRALHREFAMPDRRDSDGGDDGQLFAIGALASEFDLTTRAIRFYESKGLLFPQRVGTSRRYTRRDRARLALIVRGKNIGFSLEEIAEYLDMYDADPSQVVQVQHLYKKASAAIDDLEKRQAEIARSLADLRVLKQYCVEHLTDAGLTPDDARDEVES